MSFTCGAVFSQKKFASGAFLVYTRILSMGHFISVLALVYRFIGLENDSNSNTQ